MDKAVDPLGVENIIYYYQCSELTMTAYTRCKLIITLNIIPTANDDVITL